MALSGTFAAGRWIASCCALALVACTATTSRVRVRTDGRLRVLPQEFTTAVGCGFASGDPKELGHYVATLIDLGLSDNADTDNHTRASDTFPREAGSGVAARCTSTTTFSTDASGERSVVETGHVYAAIIDGYAGLDAPTISGSRRTGNWPAPAWQWLCGIGGLDETQLDWLIKRVQRLQTSEPVLPPASDSSDASSSSSASDAGASSTASLDASSGHSSTSAAASTAGSSEAPTAGAHDAAVESLDAGAVFDAGTRPDAALGTTTSEFSSADESTVASQLETSGVNTSNTLDAGSNTTGANTSDGQTSEPEARDWRSDLLEAAKGDFAPPPSVVRGGQSGVRGCVPLF